MACNVNTITRKFEGGRKVWEKVLNIVVHSSIQLNQPSRHILFRIVLLLWRALDRCLSLTEFSPANTRFTRAQEGTSSRAPRLFSLSLLYRSFLDLSCGIYLWYLCEWAWSPCPTLKPIALKFVEKPYKYQPLWNEDNIYWMAEIGASTTRCIS